MRLSPEGARAKSGVNLRALSQYEPGTKDINKASAKAVAALAVILGCKMEDLLEPIFENDDSSD